MDLRFWNYVIPDGSTTKMTTLTRDEVFWNYVIPDGSTTYRGVDETTTGFGTMSFQMVLLPVDPASVVPTVLELCHSRWFYY